MLKREIAFRQDIRPVVWRAEYKTGAATIKLLLQRKWDIEHLYAVLGRQRHVATQSRGGQDSSMLWS